MLSDADRQIINERAYNALKSGDDSTLLFRLEDAAFALGAEQGKAERARYEFICDRCGIRQQSKEQPEGAPF